DVLVRGVLDGDPGTLAELGERLVEQGRLVTTEGTQDGDHPVRVGLRIVRTEPALTGCAWRLRAACEQQGGRSEAAAGRQGAQGRHAHQDSFILAPRDRRS